MIGLGTIINTAAIVAAGILGVALRRFFPGRVQDTLMKAAGICVLFIGIGGAMEEMLVFEDGHLVTSGSMMMILSYALGALAGELIDIEKGIENFGVWLRKKTGSDGDNRFLDAFLTASLTVSIGAMAVVGALQDGLTGDYSLLVAKAILDFIIIMIMASSMGKGCAFAAIPVAVFQGSITAVAGLLEPIMTQQAVSNLSFIGSMLIFCVGVNLVWNTGIKVANMLPAIVFAVAFAFIL